MLRFNIAIAVAPALFLLWLFKKWDEKRPEPPGAVRTCVLLGVAMSVPAIVIELVAQHALGDAAKANGGLVNAYVIAAATEESLKLAVVIVYLWRKPYFDEVMDGILYTVAASLGFALVENVLYSAANPVTGLVRAFTAVPLHAVASGIMGYCLGRAKFSKGVGVPTWLLVGLGAAVTIHGTYDWILMSDGGFGFMEPNAAMQFSILGVVLVCGLVLFALVRHALKLDDRRFGAHPRPLFSGVSGVSGVGPFYPQPYPPPYPPPYQQPYAQPGVLPAAYSGGGPPGTAASPHAPNAPDTGGGRYGGGSGNRTGR